MRARDDVTCHSPMLNVAWPGPLEAESSPVKRRNRQRSDVADTLIIYHHHAGATRAYAAAFQSLAIR
jgi:hypothetical protein